MVCLSLCTLMDHIVDLVVQMFLIWDHINSRVVGAELIVCHRYYGPS